MLSEKGNTLEGKLEIIQKSVIFYILRRRYSINNYTFNLYRNTCNATIKTSRREYSAPLHNTMQVAPINVMPESWSSGTLRKCKIVLVLSRGVVSLFKIIVKQIPKSRYFVYRYFLVFGKVPT